MTDRSHAAAGPDPVCSGIARVSRHLRRLEALAAQHRFRKRVVRALRGGAGGGTSVLVLMKAKVVGSLAGKLAIAALVGLGLAWPFAALAILTVVAVASILSCEPTDLDGCDCRRPNARRERLQALIEQRRAWLAAPSGTAPSIRTFRMPRRT
ncbi:hypothetical protein [Methylobacterium brachiatum]